jgi:hypothetical protein
MEMIMSAEAQAVWQWITHMGMKQGDYVDTRAFAAWCSTQGCQTPDDFIPALDELVRIGYLENRNEPDATTRWEYWVA